jgi:hypothetical protein
MPGRHLLDGLMKWSRREAWSGALEEAMCCHLGAACKIAGVEMEKLPELIGDHWYMTLWGCAFEDLVSQTLEDGRNITDDYLKRRGWKEPAPTRAYIAALRSSVVSLYEVSDVVIDQGFLARDLIRGGDPVRVSEKSATRSFKQWDRISARLVTVNGRMQISGGVLLFDFDASEKLLAAIKKLAKGAHDKTALLADAAFLFSTIWLMDTLDKVLHPGLPQMTNSDGDPIEFITVRYLLAPAAKQADIRAMLALLPDLQQESNTFWNWVEHKPRRSGHKKLPDSGRSLISTIGSGDIVLGGIELKGKALTLSVNSEARAARGRALIEPLLDGLVQKPSVERETVEQMQASNNRNHEDKTSLNLSPEQERAIIHQTLADHYKRMLDESIPALGDVSPRKAMKTAKGRKKVVAWLKLLENHHAHLPAGDPMAGYDFGWLWEELGLGDQRR